MVLESNRLILCPSYGDASFVKDALYNIGLKTRAGKSSMMCGDIAVVAFVPGTKISDHVIMGRRFREITIHWDITLDNDIREMLSSRLCTKDLKTLSSLSRELVETILPKSSPYEPPDFIPMLPSDTWVDDFNFPFWNYRKGMKDFFAVDDQPTREEYELAKFSIGGPYR